MLRQILTGKAKIPFEIQHRHDRCGHYFGVRHLALGIFMMAQGFEHVITQAKKTTIWVSMSFSFTLVVGIPQL